MKKLIAILLVLVMVAGLVACTPAQEGEKTIAVIAKGETHAFWQAVKAGAVKAGEEAGYKVTFQGPTSESESEVPNQRNMVQTALNNPNVKAIVLATIGTGFMDELVTAFDKKIPVVEFDSGLYAGGADITEGKDPTIGLVATDNRKAGALVAENFYAYLKAQNVLANGYKIGVIQHDSTATGIDRAEGFVEKINALATADSITLDIQLEKKQNNAGEYKLALSSLKEWGAQAIYMTNEGVVNEVYPEVKDQVDAYKSILFCGFDCGTNQYEWIKDGGATCALLVGSVAQDSYTIGYESVKMAIAKLEGKEVKDVGIGGAWYTKENIDELKDKNVFYMG
jgi:ribose transport system substrate-binding protein